ncbi:hypothetical protein [Aureispira anguillae]|uniref:DUF4249 domain-containing protein n=1 Tax=Aureispira anguillae TaxID=2864201 RepID=A0A915YLV5_9BACT|nr:hypothetical protein [Aureispira anguillae]BDS15153.1 hypothetical protein AsAng_0059370 [Aureispira anguillae]
MKFKFVLAFVLGISLMTQYSCSNEVEVVGIWKDIPVVYGVMNREDSIQYIRIERAYLPPNQSALDVAQIPDSLYFDTNEVKIQLFYIHQPSGDTIEWPKPFERVNLADEGIVREPGIFQNNPSYVYKTTGGSTFDLLLKIQNYKTGNTFYARTEAVNTKNTILFTTPSYSLVPLKPIVWRDLNLQNNEIYQSLTVELSGNGFASIYDYKFRFHYKEYEIDNQGLEVPGTRTNKSIVWKAASDFIPPSTSQTKRVIKGENFYQFLGGALSDVTGTNTRRCAGYLEVFVDGGSASLRDYILARKSNEGFVGGLYPSEPYSNVQGGYGVFATSSRLERKDRASDPRLMRMSNLTYQHLSEGQYTKHLGFESFSPCY